MTELEVVAESDGNGDRTVRRLEPESAVVVRGEVESHVVVLDLGERRNVSSKEVFCSCFDIQPQLSGTLRTGKLGNSCGHFPEE